MHAVGTFESLQIAQLLHKTQLNFQTTAAKMINCNASSKNMGYLANILPISFQSWLTFSRQSYSAELIILNCTQVRQLAPIGLNHTSQKPGSDLMTTAP